MKELEQVAKTFTSLAQLYMVSGPWRPVYKTGNLYKNIESYNTPSRMITSRPSRSKTKFKIPEKSFNISLQYAPDVKGVNPPRKSTKYGKFVEEGFEHKSGAIIKARPFAQKASQDPLLKKTIDAYIGNYMEKDFLPVIKIGLARAFRSLSAERAKAR